MARGRKVNSNGEMSKKLLLEKAVELFSIHGYHQTKISDIVKAANLTQPTFYLYFESKESLFNDLNTQFQNDIYEILEENTETHKAGLGTFREKVEDKLINIFNYFAVNPRLTKIGFYESEQALIIKERMVEILIGEITEEHKVSPFLVNINARTLAECLVGSIERLTLTGLLTEKSTSEELANSLGAIYFVEQKELQHT